MLLQLSRITIAVVLSLMIHCVDGNQRTLHIIETFSDNGDTVINSGDGSSGDGSSVPCYMYEECSCYSFDNALAYLTGNALLNIITDVMLSTLMKASNIENISIIGHNNPIVNCKGIGGIYFTFCNNCIIQGITWNECGSGRTQPGLKLKYCSHITIQSCSFQHSIGQAVALINIIGDVNINHCKFVNNSHYRGHGAAISYSSNIVINSPTPFLFQICNCNFTHNEGTYSLVYIENEFSEWYNDIILCDSKFYHN